MGSLDMVGKGMGGASDLLLTTYYLLLTTYAQLSVGSGGVWYAPLGAKVGTIAQFCGAQNTTCRSNAFANKWLEPIRPDGKPQDPSGPFN